MANFLRQGQHFVIGNGSGQGEENTIQSFNGLLYKYNQGFFVELISPDHILQADAASVDNDNEFFIASNTNVVSGSATTIEVTLPANTFEEDELEVGDFVALRDSTHPARGVYRYQITEVSYTDGDSNGTIMATLQNPHPVNDTYSDVDIISSEAFDYGGSHIVDIHLADIPGLPFLDGGHFQTVTVDSDGGTNVDLVTSGNPAANITNIYYDPSRNILELWTDTLANRNTLNSQIQAALPGDLDIVTSTQTVSFDRLGTTKDILVGSKNTNSAVIATPITLPEGVIIRSGEGVEDIFLIALNQ